MKVLALVTDAFGGYGGIAQYNRDFLTALSKQKEISEIYILPRICPENYDELPDKITQYRARSGRIQYSISSLFLAHKIKPDIVVCSHLYHGPLAVQIASLHSAKLTSQLHGIEVWKKLPPAQLQPLLKSDIVFCVSRDTCKRYTKQAVFPPKNGAVLHNTVGSAFKPGDVLKARKKFGLAKEIALLSVGRLDAKQGHKGQDTVIKALPNIIAANSRKVIYLIAGAGEDTARLATIAKERGVSENVRFLGKVPTNDLPDLYRSADLFVLPSKGEGFGIVYLEAMACGTQAIGLNIGGAPDALMDGELGWCVSEEQFEQTLIAALNSPSPPPSSLYDAVQTHFGIDCFEKKLERILIPHIIKN